MPIISNLLLFSTSTITTLQAYSKHTWFVHFPILYDLSSGLTPPNIVLVFCLLGSLKQAKDCETACTTKLLKCQCLILIKLIFVHVLIYRGNILIKISFLKCDFDIFFLNKRNKHIYSKIPISILDWARMS